MCYISYPRVTYRDDPWVTVTQINPRGRVDGTSDDDEPLQNSVPTYIPAPAPAAPRAAAQQDPGVMPVELLVQQPGREHLPVLQPNPRRGHSTWLVFFLFVPLYFFL